jgi:hypothetical protein
MCRISARNGDPRYRDRRQAITDNHRQFGRKEKAGEGC